MILVHSAITFLPSPARTRGDRGMLRANRMAGTLRMLAERGQSSSMVDAVAGGVLRIEQQHKIRSQCCAFSLIDASLNRLDSVAHRPLQNRRFDSPVAAQHLRPAAP